MLGRGGARATSKSGNSGEAYKRQLRPRTSAAPQAIASGSPSAVAVGSRSPGEVGKK